MDALKKQAKKLTETVASTQQAVFKQFANIPGMGSSSENVITDEAELERHKELEFLYGATKSAKHFQREVIKGIEGIINSNLKHIEAISRLQEECKKYGTDSPGGEGTSLGRAAISFGSAHALIERERDIMDRALGTQVGDPLKAMVTGAPLEDARNLTQRYDRLRQEAEALWMEIQKRRQKDRDGSGNPENTAKLQAGEVKMKELESSMSILGKEAASAMTAVAAQQQRQTLQRLIAMVEAEKAFHDSASSTLDKLLTQMVAERQRPDLGAIGARKGFGGAATDGAGKARGSSNPFDEADAEAGPPPPSYEDTLQEGKGGKADPSSYFLAEVVHSFEAEGTGELSLRAGDYVVVRQVASNGWSEGECRGRAGWFPSDFVERRNRVPARKIVDWAES